jgi:hypothetical protein
MMRLRTITGLAAIAILSSAALLPGQTVDSDNFAGSPTISVSTRNLTPGTIAPVSAPKVSIAYVAEQRSSVNRLWVASLFAVAAASGMDAATSWGKYEGNSLLASSNGRFGTKGITIKAGLGAAALIPQIFFMRNHKQLRSRLAISNFAEAAVFTGIAVHNIGVVAPGR